ncbi:MAG: zf-HC2 domain-containing protein [Acidobacteriota bacterium]
MNGIEETTVNCTQFEELLTDYIDKALGSNVHKAVAAHAMSCPLCHSLLNEVKDSLQLCHELSAPNLPMTRLEARVLSMTMPETAMGCEEFEGHLTDYLDGFLPAQVFHRWERHAVLCKDCTDLPGMVVRSIGACLTYKMEEMAVPEGLHAKILESTIGTITASDRRASWGVSVLEWFRGLRFPLPVPQLAPVAMMFILAFLVFSQTVSADGSLSGIYTRSVELAEQTYKQSSDVWGGTPETPPNGQSNQGPVHGTTYVDQGDGK